MFMRKSSLSASVLLEITRNRSHWIDCLFLCNCLEVLSARESFKQFDKRETILEIFLKGESENCWNWARLLQDGFFEKG